MRLRTLTSWTTKEGKRRRIRRYRQYLKDCERDNYTESFDTWLDEGRWGPRKMGSPRKKLKLCAWKSRTGQKRVIRLYGMWRKMMQRCSDKCEERYIPYYYGKGIRVCQEWQDFDTFREWAIATGYGKDLTIDRIDSGKNYCPENCEWVTRAENTRRAHT